MSCHRKRTQAEPNSRWSGHVSIRGVNGPELGHCGGEEQKRVSRGHPKTTSHSACSVVVYTQFERDHESVIPCTKIDFSGVSFTLNVTAEGHVNMRDSGNFWRTTVFGTVLQQLECGVSLAFADRVLPRGGS